MGLGVGEQHLRAYLAAGCRLARVYDLDRDRAHAAIARYGQGRAADSFGAVLSDPMVQVVSIASFDDDHAAQVVAALEAGKHVFVEKPLCRTFEELDRIRRAWQKSGKALASNLVLRSAPLYGWLRGRIAQGRFGKIYAFDGDYLFGRIEKITEGWRKDVDDYSVMQGGGIHLVDLMLGLTGEHPNRVTSIGNRICTQETPFRYNDFMASTFHFESGLVGRITANFGCVHRHQHVVRIFGTKAAFIYDDAGARLHASRDPKAESERPAYAPLPEHKGVRIPAFVEAIAAGRDTRAETEHEFDVIRACLAADTALAKGSAVEIAYA